MMKYHTKTNPTKKNNLSFHKDPSLPSPSSIKTTTQNEKKANTTPGSYSKCILRISRYIASKLQPAHEQSVAWLTSLLRKQLP